MNSAVQMMNDVWGTISSCGRQLPPEVISRGRQSCARWESLGLRGLHSVLVAVILLVMGAGVVRGAITTTGNVEPDPNTTTQGTNLYVGRTADGAMSDHAVSLQTGATYLGYEPDVDGVINLSGFLYWRSFGGMSIGYAGNGTVNVAGSPKVYAGFQNILGYQSGASGHLIVTGDEALWDAVSTNFGVPHGDDFVGYGGEGILDVSDGGHARMSITYFGYQPGASGKAWIDGDSNYQTGTLYLGYEGDGYIHMTNGGNLDTQNSKAYLGYMTGATGRVELEGKDSEENDSYWRTSTGAYIGYGGYGQVFIHDGASADNSIAYYGYLPGSVGEVVVDGVDSKYTATDRGKGYVIGYGGEGRLTVRNGGASSHFRAYVGYEVSGSGEVLVEGEGSELFGQVYLGEAGSGRLTIRDGGVSEGSIIAGLGAGSSGSVTVDGAGSLIDNYQRSIIIGLEGTGTMDVMNGGKVISGNFSVGEEMGSHGVVTVTGGSVMQIDGNTRIGEGGFGELRIEDGGQVTLGTFAYLSSDDGSEGLLSVSGQGSSLMHNALTTFYVGHRDYGEARVLDGGSIQSGTVNMGYYGSDGLIEVSGAGSTWEIDGDLGVYAGSELHIGQSGLIQCSGQTIVDKSESWDSAVYLDGGELHTVDLIAGASSLRGTGDIYTGGFVGDVDLVFDATHGVQQQFVLADGLGQHVVIHIDAKSIDRQHGIIGAGAGGDGSVRIADGVVVESGKGCLGMYFGANGEGRVEGPGTAWLVTEMYIGEAGNGTLGIYDGGRMEGDRVILSNRSFSDGDVTVDGIGSSIRSRLMHVGTNSGCVARLLIADGAYVQNSERLHIDGGDASVTLRGNGSRLECEGELMVGRYFNGALRIEEGASMEYTADVLQLGSEVGSMGVVEVSGSGSAMYVSSMVIQSGMLNINGGSLVEVGEDIMVGWSSDLRGSITLDGGTLHAGANIRARSGFLNMYNRSLLDVDGDVLLGTTTGSRATLTMNGGILRLHGGGLRYVNGDISVLSGRIEGVGELDWSSLFTQFGGTLAPGLDGEAGVTDILRSYRVYGMGEVEIEVGNLNAGGDEYDRLIVGQTALLGGKLVLKLMDNARFQAGQEITIMTAGQLIGEFGSVVQPFEDGLGDVFDVVYGDTSVKLVALRAVPGPGIVVGLVVAGVGMMKRRRRG